MAVIITAIVAGGAGFWGGNLYGQSADPRGNFNRQTGAYGMIGQRGNGTQQNADFSGGNIIKKDDTSITVQLKDGSSKIIFLSGATKIMKSVQGLASDLTVGEQVTVSGAKNLDGSVTAQSIQIRPAQQISQ